MENTTNAIISQKDLANVANIIIALEAQKQYIDTHNHRNVVKRAGVDYIGYVLLHDIRRNEHYICPAFKNHFSLNPLYLEDGKLYLETGSVGGVVNMASQSIEEAILEYNTIHAEGNKNFATEQELSWIATVE